MTTTDRAATDRNAEGVRVLVCAHRRRGRMGVQHG